MENSVNKKIYFKLYNFIFILPLLIGFTTSAFSKHLKPEEYVCKPENKRTFFEKQLCKIALDGHRLCKLDVACALRDRALLEKKAKEQEEKIDKQEQELMEKEDALRATATCGDLVFNHMSGKKAAIYKLPNTESTKISNISKGQDLLFISPSSKNKKWNFVKIKKEKICADGFIQAKFVVKKDDEDKVIDVGPKLISITYPEWKIEDKLMVIDAEGTLSISGAIQEGKIDTLIINEEEEIINGDNSFSYLMMVPKSGAEIRIVGNKNGKKVKELSFQIKVGN